MCIVFFSVPLMVAAGSFTSFFKKETVDEKEQIRKIVTDGMTLMQQGMAMQAQNAFHKALELSTEFLRSNKIDEKQHRNHQVFIFDQMANCALGLGFYEDAEVLFKDTMKLALSLGMKETDNAMIEMSLKLSTIYIYTGRDQIAELGVKHCITEQKIKLQRIESLNITEEDASDMTAADLAKIKQEEINTKVLLGKSYQNYALLYLKNRDFKNAKPLLELAIKISNDVLGPSNDQTYVILNDLATCKIMLKEYKEAEELLIDAVSLLRKANNALEAALLANLGALYIRTDCYSQAEIACKRGLKVAEKNEDAFLKAPCQSCLDKLEELRNKEKNKK